MVFYKYKCSLKMIKGDKKMNEKTRILRKNALSILELAVKSVDPYEIITKSVKLKNGTIEITNLDTNEKTKIKLKNGGKIRVVAFGKASLAMAKAFKSIVDVDEEVVVIPYGQKGDWEGMRVIEAAHPVPDENSAIAATEVLKIAEKSGKNDIFIALVSGGGSALLSAPKGLTLKQKNNLTKQLLKSGCSINEMNTVRKHISAIKGGKLAEAAMPATTVSLVLSDVLKDPLDIIASGPTTEDKTTFEQTRNILKKYELWSKIPEKTKEYIKHGIEDEKTVEKQVFHTLNVIIGNNYIAAMAAKKKAEALGYNSLLLTTNLEGESKEIAKIFSSLAKAIRLKNTPIKAPAAIIAGGETTVKVKGDGRGGRNQELALSAALSLPQEDDGIVIASIGTDGIDGMSDAAGAIADGFTIKRAKEANLDAKAYLKNNDSNTFFSKLNDTIVTGRTGTNVNDIIVLLVE